MGGEGPLPPLGKKKPHNGAPAEINGRAPSKTNKAGEDRKGGGGRKEREATRSPICRVCLGREREREGTNKSRRGVISHSF